jgi:hypothetical protein
MALTAVDSKRYKNGKAHCKFPCTSTDDYQIGRDECTDGFCSKGTDEPPMPVPHQGRENIATHPLKIIAISVIFLWKFPIKIPQVTLHFPQI